LSKTPNDDEQPYGTQLDYLQLPCDERHAFHSGCLVRYFLERHPEPPKCPMCRAEFKLDDNRHDAHVVGMLTSDGRGGVNAGVGMRLRDYMATRSKLLQGRLLRHPASHDAETASREQLADQLVEASSLIDGRSAERVHRLVAEMGVDVDITYPNGSSGSTALMMAAVRNDVECVRALLEHGASIAKLDSHGSRQGGLHAMLLL
jgi:hypothetical protein